VLCLGSFARSEAVQEFGVEITAADLVHAEYIQSLTLDIGWDDRRAVEAIAALWQSRGLRDLVKYRNHTFQLNVRFSGSQPSAAHTRRRTRRLTSVRPFMRLCDGADSKQSTMSLALRNPIRYLPTTTSCAHEVSPGCHLVGQTCDL
jgi:hypothetical protein